MLHELIKEGIEVLKPIEVNIEENESATLQ